MKITKERLERLGVNSQFYAWYLSCGETDLSVILDKLIEQKHYDWWNLLLVKFLNSKKKQKRKQEQIELTHSMWANWLVVKLLNDGNKIGYAMFSAEEVIGVFEKKYPDKKTPREVIEMSKDYLVNPSVDKVNILSIASFEAFADGYYAVAHDKNCEASNAANASSYLANAALCYKSYALAVKHNPIKLYQDVVLSTESAIEADSKARAKIIRYGLSLINNQRS